MPTESHWPKALQEQIAEYPHPQPVGAYRTHGSMYGPAMCHRTPSRSVKCAFRKHTVMPGVLFRVEPHLHFCQLRLCCCQGPLRDGCCSCCLLSLQVRLKCLQSKTLQHIHWKQGPNLSASQQAKGSGGCPYGLSHGKRLCLCSLLRKHTATVALRRAQHCTARCCDHDTLQAVADGARARHTQCPNVPAPSIHTTVHHAHNM
jgi:hypothetical protein